MWEANPKASGVQIADGEEGIIILLFLILHKNMFLLYLYYVLYRLSPVFSFAFSESSQINSWSNCVYIPISNKKNIAEI